MAVLTRGPAHKQDQTLKDISAPDLSSHTQVSPRRIKGIANTYDSPETKLHDDAFIFYKINDGYNLDISIADVDAVLARGEPVSSVNLVEGNVSPTVTFRFKFTDDFVFQNIEYLLSETKILKNVNVKEADALLSQDSSEAQQVKLLQRAAASLKQYYSKLNSLDHITGLWDPSEPSELDLSECDSMREIVHVFMLSAGRAAADLVSNFKIPNSSSHASAIYRTAAPKESEAYFDPLDPLGNASFVYNSNLANVSSMNDVYSHVPLDGMQNIPGMRVTSPMRNPTDVINMTVLKAIITGQQIPDLSYDIERFISNQNSIKSKSDKDKRRMIPKLQTKAMLRNLFLNPDCELTRAQRYDLFTRRLQVLPYQRSIWTKTLEAFTSHARLRHELLSGAESRKKVLNSRSNEDYEKKLVSFEIETANSERIRVEAQCKRISSMGHARQIVHAASIIKFLAPDHTTGDFRRMILDAYPSQDINLLCAIREKIPSVQKVVKNKPDLIAAALEKNKAQTQKFDSAAKALFDNPEFAIPIIDKWITRGELVPESNVVRQRIAEPLIELETGHGLVYSSLKQRGDQEPTKKSAHLARAEAILRLTSGISDRREFQKYVHSLKNKARHPVLT